MRSTVWAIGPEEQSLDLIIKLYDELLAKSISHNYKKHYVGHRATAAGINVSHSLQRPYALQRAKYGFKHKSDLCSKLNFS